MPPKYKMRCHYDILGVNRDANESELKRAYRKMALEWHPDKNSHRPEEAETRFKEVRGAYETLSDPNERAWYDSHREAILKAGKHAAGGEDMRPEDEINLMPYFTANAFRGFGDDPGGFYDTYSTLFTALDKQEQAASLAAGKDHFKSSPSFGTSDAPWVQVKSFYAHWGLFATLKTFAWADEYNLAEAQNRKVRRLMDEENKKLRRGEAREFNDAVRQLIAFVRKRDKRYIAHSAEQAKLEKARAAAAERKRSAAKKARQEAASAYVEADWAQAEAPEWLAREIEKEEEAKARKEAAKQDLYCPVCKKKFKSQKQWENHEQSKQHKAAVQKLKEQMMEDEEVVKAALDDDSDEESDVEEVDEKLRAELDSLDVNEDEDDDDEDDEEEDEERKDLYRNWVPKDKSKNPRLASDDESDSEFGFRFGRRRRRRGRRAREDDGTRQDQDRDQDPGPTRTHRIRATRRKRRARTTPWSG
jgi:DnaJ family protein A protein 5